MQVEQVLKTCHTMHKKSTLVMELRMEEIAEISARRSLCLCHLTTCLSQDITVSVALSPSLKEEVLLVVCFPSPVLNSDFWPWTHVCACRDVYEFSVSCSSLLLP